MLPAAYGLAVGIPEPDIQDEFSYLLGADTFLQGRLTNPAPAFPEFYEASHVLVTPTYASKYPPGQALALAVGTWLGGNPIWGVWLSCGFFAASLCWMLQAWTSSRWALAGTLTAIVTLGVSTYWAQSYWGGMLAAGGSALLFGGLRRTLRWPRVGPSLLSAVGVVILANTRIYEGLLVCIVPAALLAWWLIATHRVPVRAKLVSWMVPFGGVLLIGGALMIAYNHAVTGRWFSTPQGVFSRQYFGQGAFLFSPLEQPERRPIPRLASFYDSFRHPPRQRWHLARHAAVNAYDRLPATLESALGVVGYLDEARRPHRALLFWIVVLAIATLLHRWARIAVAAIAVVVLGQSIVWWWIPHYTAPVVPLVIAIVVMSLARYARAGSRIQSLAPVAVVLLAIASVVLPALMALALNLPPRDPASNTPTGEAHAGVSKADVLRRLETEGGSHLVFVSYEDGIAAGNGEWVYNPADLEGAHVLFVHDLGSTKNAELIAASPDRRSWRVRLSKYQRTSGLDPYASQ
jgi:hypothetical protein